MTDYHQLTSTIARWPLQATRIFLRADLNVTSTQEPHILKLQTLLPTLDFLIKKGAIIILATHRGRPSGYQQNLSTYSFIEWFAHQGYPTIFAETPDQAIIKSRECKPSTLIVLENLRFFSEEYTNDYAFAQLLACTADYYINDGFGIMHRTDTSVTTLAQLFRERATIGFLVERELRALEILRANTPQPYSAIIGGAKTATKIPLIQQLINRADTILLCPPLVFTFLKALGKPVGASLVDDSMIEQAQNIIEQQKLSSTRIIFPIDYYVSNGPLNAKKYRTIRSDDFTETTIGISIGAATLSMWFNIIQKAQSIFFNGVMGFADYPETLQATESLLHNLGQIQGYTVVAGGDTAQLAYNLDLADHIDFLSTGGGATITYITGNKLPGLDALMHSN